MEIARTTFQRNNFIGFFRIFMFENSEEIFGAEQALPITVIPLTA